MGKRHPFWKFHSCGNSCLIVSDLEAPFFEYAGIAERVLHPHYGVGADNLLVIRPSDEADFELVGYNSDGTLVGLCANGVRCVARFLKEREFLRSANTDSVSFLLEGRRIEALFEDQQGTIGVNVGVAVFEPAAVPVITKEAQLVNAQLKVLGRSFCFTAVNTGNPHCVLFVDEVNKDDVTRFGPTIEHHSMFPEKTNVEFVQVLSRERIRVEFWERAVGVTLASGSGSAGAVSASYVSGYTEAEVEIELPGGVFSGRIDPQTMEVTISGPTEMVCEGVFATH